MITKISMNKVTCYKSLTSLTTDKKINLLYGLNGTGKSTLSDYLYNNSDTRYKDCSIEGLADEDILVYNQTFIKDYFYQPENLKGIFTLSKENKEAEEKVRKAEAEIDRLGKIKEAKSIEVDKTNNSLHLKRQAAENKTWEIKSKYTGGDRVLEYCIEGLKGNKETLFNFISSIIKPESQPQNTIDYLKKEVEAIQGSDAQKHDSLQLIEIRVTHIEADQLFDKVIVGNENSTVAKLIKNLGNSDWVQDGLKLIPLIEGDNIKQCPFCQENTITPALIKNIENYFDETYSNDINSLNSLLDCYENTIKSLPEKTVYEANPFVVDNKSAFDNLFYEVRRVLEDNKNLIISKIKSPSQQVKLNDSRKAIGELNGYIDDLNKKISEHNEKIQNKAAALKDLKRQFWEIMRWNYDQTISAFENEKKIIDKQLKEVFAEIKKIDEEINIQKDIITEQQKKTVNIDKAIENINAGLIELGIDGFKIEKYSETLYEVVRTEKCENTFETLSEGEKMIISFLYFRELCKGKKSIQSSTTKKIIIIDDPISSLSHIYIFNIGQMIKNDFFNSGYEQVFLLTHSLYFFYEMTYLNKEKREEKQKLFRLSRNNGGTQICEMKYEEIQNDYHSYWNIVKDEANPPALIANCMRNIIEYFFDFVERKDLNDVFQKAELKAVKYQAFCRYINRESHSVGQNIFDIKEFDYSCFREAFALVFNLTGYELHYKKMMKQ